MEYQELLKQYDTTIAHQAFTSKVFFFQIRLQKVLWRMLFKSVFAELSNEMSSEFMFFFVLKQRQITT